LKTYFKIRTVSPRTIELKTADAWFSPDHSTDDADALLCNWAPSEELCSFPRRKAWYCCEPECQFQGLGGDTWPSIRDRLDPSEFLYHNHPDPLSRIPHVTHFEDLTVTHDPDRLDHAIAIVSSHGGNPWKQHPDLTFRNRFITHPFVDLFGRSGWKRYKASCWSLRGREPGNYRGELPGDWPAEGKRALMARYKVAVCMENMNEPTERSRAGRPPFARPSG